MSPLLTFQEEPLALLGVASTPVLGVLSAGPDLSLLVGSLLRPVRISVFSSGRSCARSSHSSSSPSGDSSPLGGIPNSSALFPLSFPSYIKTLSHRVPGLKTEDFPRLACSRVEMVPNQVMSEMVLDGGWHFIPAGTFGLHTLSLLLASLVAHDRAKEDTRTHTGKEHQSTNTINVCTIINVRTIINVGTVHKPRQGGINSAPL